MLHILGCLYAHRPAHHFQPLGLLRRQKAHSLLPRVVYQITYPLCLRTPLTVTAKSHKYFARSDAKRWKSESQIRPVDTMQPSYLHIEGQLAKANDALGTASDSRD